MLHKTLGIVLGISKYTDKYAIAQVFTRDFGRVSYLLPKSRGKNSKTNPILFSPLSVLKMEVEHLPLREIQRLKEVERMGLFYNIGADVKKVSIVFFLSEFLSKILRETQNNEVLFDYLHRSIEVLEETDTELANFHLTFMLGLTKFLGIYPNFGHYSPGCYFDLLNSEFSTTLPLHSYHLKPAESKYLITLSRINYSNMRFYKMSRNDRNRIIDQLLIYYRLHLCDFAEMKSTDVLRELF